MIAIGGATFLAQRAWAQLSKTRRLALLSGGSSSLDLWRPFREAMRDLGYSEDDLVIEARWAEGHNERLGELARELVRLAPEVIVTGSSAAALAAKGATSTTPIVTAFTADPVGSGLAASIARPGGNVTGLSNMQEDTTGKELDLLKTAAPQVTRVAVVSNPANPSHVSEFRGARDAASALAVEIIPIEVSAPEEIDGAFNAVTKKRADALLVLADPLFTVEAHRIATLASSSHLPAIYGLREHVMAGGLMSYGPDLKDSYRRAAIYVDKILKGAKPADLPFEQPTKFELVVNLKAAKALGLPIPESPLSRADEVIE
jgi:putative tryptophan/tyrosine transport system substrate-binding protein